MISKVITGKSFAGCCRYVCKSEKEATVLYVDGVRGFDSKLMAEDFEQNRLLLPNKHKAVFHGILSFHPDDKVTDPMMLQIAQAYLERVGLVNTQVAVIKHADKAHPHLHVVANLVDMNGKAIKDNWIGLRGKKIAQALTREYGLTPALRKDISRTNLEALNEEEAARYEIYEAIKAALALASSFSGLKLLLLKKGIDTLYKKSPTVGIQGVSFRKGKFSFKGSSIDRAFSFNGLQKTLGLRQRIAQPIRRSRGASALVFLFTGCSKCAII